MKVRSRVQRSIFSCSAATACVAQVYFDLLQTENERFRTSDTMEAGKWRPLYTLQRVEGLRVKQQQVWQRIILEHFATAAERSSGDGGVSSRVLVLDSFPLFESKVLNCKLSAEGRLEVAKRLVATGHGQWQTPEKTLLVFVKTPSEWASIIYDFVQQNALTGTIYTIYEIHSGDLTKNSQIEGIDPTACFEALKVLQGSGKAELYMSEESVDETGVKFV